MQDDRKAEEGSLLNDDVPPLPEPNAQPGDFARAVRLLVAVRRFVQKSKTAKFEPSDLSLMCSDCNKERLRSLGNAVGLARSLGTSIQNGLSFPSDQATSNSQKYGTNIIPDPPQTSLLTLVWKALGDAMLRLLLLSAAISLILGLIPQTSQHDKEGWIKGVAIFIAVFVVVTIGAGQDYSKERQFRRLNKVKSDRVVEVIRNGVQEQVSVFDIIVGDIAIVQTGDKIPADGVFISGADITVDESGANGEPEPVRKEASLTGKTSPFFISGTQVLSGYGKMLIVAVGVNSFNGKTLMSLREGGDETPLQAKLESLANRIGKFGMVFASIVFISVLIKVLVETYTTTPRDTSGLAQKIVEIVVLCITVVVVAVPEGLPLAVAITLAYSMNRMLKDNNLVKHLDACETMGGATTICSDKTGTLTANKMTVVRGSIAGQEFDLMEAIREGQATGAKGSIERMVTNFSAQLDPELLRLLVDGIAVNSTAYPNPKPDKSGKNMYLGNSTECALMEFASKFGFDLMAQREALAVSHLISFSSARKRMSTVVPDGQQGYILFCKGAAEIIVGKCSSLAQGEDIETQRQNYYDVITDMAANALRTIGMAYKRISRADLQALKSALENGDESANEKMEVDMTLLGVVGIQDPLREEVPGAVAKCKRAGVRVIMVTGDNLVTAKNIGKNCGIYEEGVGIAMEGPQFRQLSEEELIKVCANLQVLARSSPTDKQLLVKTIKDTGEVVAVTGDGTNDAPALKLANVGFAMGISGTEVAREAADVVLMDDNFASIVKAIMWGRNVFDGIRSFLQFQLTVSFVGGLLTLIGALSNNHSESPLSAVQLLWINLIMDTFAALALATQVPTEKLLDFAPYGRDEPLISPLMWRRIIFQGLYQLAVLFMLVYAGDNIFGVETDGVEHMTIVFNSFVFCQLFNMFNARVIHHSINICENLCGNSMFFGVLLFEVIIQAVFVEIGGSFTSTTSLLKVPAAWPGCILIGAGSIPVGLLANALPYKEKRGGEYRRPGKEQNNSVELDEVKFHI